MLESNSIPSALPASATALPSSKHSSVLLWAACGCFLLRHLDQIFPRSCLCADNFQEFASLWNLECMWPVTDREVFSCCIHTAGASPEFMGSLNAMAVPPSFTPRCFVSREFYKLLRAETRREEILSIFMRLSFMHFIASAPEVVDKRFSSSAKWEHLLLI